MNWEEFKTKYVDKGKEPDIENTLTAAVTGEGSHGKTNHPLAKYTIHLDRYPTNLNKAALFEAEFSYAICLTCKEIRWKKIVAINNLQRIAYQRHLMARDYSYKDR
jgi:hypothetical protein